MAAWLGVGGLNQLLLYRGLVSVERRSRVVAFAWRWVPSFGPWLCGWNTVDCCIVVARSFTVGGVVQAGSVKAWLWCVDSRLAGVQTNGSIQLGIVLPKAGGVCMRMRWAKPLWDWDGCCAFYLRYNLMPGWYWPITFEEDVRIVCTGGSSLVQVCSAAIQLYCFVSAVVVLITQWHSGWSCQ